jgi:uncharacterized membrane protein YphA (DoxX/SURF4 family)
MTEPFLILTAAMTGAAGRILLALIFLQAGVQKLRHLEEFQGVVLNYRIVPRASARSFAVATPFLEMGLAAALMIGISPLAELAAAALLSVFAAAMTVNVLRGRTEIDCGCFQSSLRQLISWWTVARNLVLTAVALLAAASPSISLPFVGLLQAALAGLVGFALYGALNTLDAARIRTATLNFEGA